MQDIVGQCPVTGWNIIVFQGSSSGSWGVARNVRNQSQKYEYLDRNLNWASVNNRGVDKDEAYELAKRWIAHAEANRESTLFPDSNSCNGGAMQPQPIIPLILDKDRMRVQFKCPRCGMNHNTQIKSDKWHEIVEVIKRKCPKEGEAGQEFHIRLWTGDRDHPAGTPGVIHPLPKYDCPECWGTGEYVGFNAKEPCSTCFPKPKDDLKDYKSGSFP